MFVSRCRLLDWCAVLSGGVLLEVLSFRCNSLFCPLSHPSWLVLFYTVDVITFSWVLTFFATAFVHCVVTSVRPLG